MSVSIVANSDTIQIIRGTVTTDQYGSERIDWSSVTVHASGKATIQHFTSTEEDMDRQTTIEGLRLVSDDKRLFDFLPTDRVVYAGKTYEVDGEIQLWRLFGKPHHVEVYLRRVVG